ncbi:MAG: NifB/NifX family molybdenum-iron cluster-binding protein [Candidatus Alkanophagales archaeon]
MDELEAIRRRKLQELMRAFRPRLRVAVPTYRGGLDDLVCEHFGRAPTFTIVDLETGDVEVLQNYSEHFGGSGYPPEILAEKGVSAVLCKGLGPKALAMFRQLGIEVYVGASGTVRDAVRDFQARMLREASEMDTCDRHGHGHGREREREHGHGSGRCFRRL